MRFKDLGEEEVIFCSSMLSTGITWLFNNQSEVLPGVMVSQGGRSIMIPSSDESVYGDYSCFQNNTFVNCTSLYISGKWLAIYNNKYSSLGLHDNQVIQLIIATLYHVAKHFILTITHLVD